jgi:hypothetical protein
MRIKNLRQNDIFFQKEIDDSSFRIYLFEFQRNQNKPEFTLLKMFQQSFNFAALSVEVQQINKNSNFLLHAFSKAFQINERSFAKSANNPFGRVVCKIKIKKRNFYYKAFSCSTF